MADMIGLAASAAGCGVFGLIGTVIGRIAGLFERRRENAQEQAHWKHEAALLELQINERACEIAGQESLAQTAGDWQRPASSMASEAFIGDSYRWVNAVRAFACPLLTLLLWLITSRVWFGASAQARTSIVETDTLAAIAATLCGCSKTGEAGERRVEPFPKRDRLSPA